MLATSLRASAFTDIPTLTLAEIHFPYLYIAPPHLPHAFSYINVDHYANICIKVTIEEVKKGSTVYHTTF